MTQSSDDRPVPRRLLLWDIDGTLLSTGGAGERAIRLATRDVLGADDDLRTIEIAGRTDAAIARQVLHKYGVPLTDETIAEFLNAYIRNLAEQLPLTSGRVLPGIGELLPRLAQDSRVALGLLTGNLRRGAKLKLSHYGLWEYFGFGAFADDHHDRNELGRFACERGGAHHRTTFEPIETFVIGDTPHDIACGRVFCARTVAVATGGYSMEQLAGHRPDLLVADFSDVQRALEMLLPT
jgi:phosphoglycolate phosphatase